MGGEPHLLYYPVSSILCLVSVSNAQCTRRPPNVLRDFHLVLDNGRVVWMFGFVGHEVWECLDVVCDAEFKLSQDKA